MYMRNDLLTWFCNSTFSGSSFQIQLEAEGLKPRLVFSTTRIDFGIQIVQRSRDLQVPYSASARVFNNDNHVIKFRLAETKEENKVLSVNPTDAVLQPGETVSLTVLFVPRDAQSYEESLPIFLDDDKDASMELILIGIGQYPRLKFDRREVILPAVCNIRASSFSIQQSVSWQFMFTWCDFWNRAQPFQLCCPCVLGFPDFPENIMDRHRNSGDAAVLVRTP